MNSDLFQTLGKSIILVYIKAFKLNLINALIFKTISLYFFKEKKRVKKPTLQTKKIRIFFKIFILLVLVIKL